MVWFMTPMDVLDFLKSQGLGLLRAVRGMSKRDLGAYHVSSSDAGAMLRAAETYFGPTRQKRQQARAVEAAAEASIGVLLVVEKQARKLHDDADTDRWDLRLHLLGLRGTLEEITQQATAHVRELNRRAVDAEKKSFGKRALRGGKNTDAAGLRTITVTLPERLMATTLASLRSTAATLRGENPRLSYEQAMADAFLRHAGSSSGGRAAPPVPMVIIGLPDWAKLHRHDGDETVFALTDGTTITGAELAQSRMADHHLVGIYDPVAGPVNLYRSQRHASSKQRALLAAESILCAWPGCTTSADECQVHHLEAWEPGGETNLENLAIACPVHNGRNDDDPDKPPIHGRLQRAGGEVVFQPPDGGPTESNTHPVRKRGANSLHR